MNEYVDQIKVVLRSCSEESESWWGQGCGGVRGQGRSGVRAVVGSGVRVVVGQGSVNHGEPLRRFQSSYLPDRLQLVHDLLLRSQRLSLHCRSHNREVTTL